MEDLIVLAIGMGATFLLAYLAPVVGTLAAKTKRDKDDEGIIVAWIVLFFLCFMGAKEYLKLRKR